MDVCALRGGAEKEIMHGKYIWVHRIFSSSLWTSVSGTHTLHSTRLLWTTPAPDWQMKHLNDYNNTRLSLQQWDWALSKDTLADQYRPSVKNDCIDLGYLKLFYTLSLNKSSSCKYWRSRLNIENFLHLFPACSTWRGLLLFWSL